MTLPTRPDGGVDRHLERARRFMCAPAAELKDQNETALAAAIRTLADEFRQHTAHTRERCARDLQLEAKDYRRLAAIKHPPLAGLNEQISIVLEKRASAIRGMED